MGIWHSGTDMVSLQPAGTERQLALIGLGSKAVGVGWEALRQVDSHLWGASAIGGLGRPTDGCDIVAMDDGGRTDCYIKRYL